MSSAVIDFYNDDEMSSVMPGKKDFISLRNDDGSKVQVQKRLVLCNLKELHKIFKSRFPQIEIGFSSFASLRPKHCILAGGSGTHTVCVCSIHQNIKLMILGGKLCRLTEGSNLPVGTYNDCLNAIVCEEPTTECYFNTCANCPGVKNIKQLLLTEMDNNGIDEVSYKQWVSTPKVTLETTIKNTLDFVNDFCEKLVALLPHNFIAKEQAAYLRALKESITENEFIVIVDFAENYAFVVQDAAPGFHWNNDQATVSTVVIYYKVDNQLTHQSMVIISDCLNHDSIAVHIYSEIIINFIKSLSSTVAKIFFFSDGAPQQYKNYKHFSNLSHYRREFGVIVEWNFFATAHGKGPCDGVGGTIKRKASRASLQLPPDQQILTPKQLFEWASQNLTKMNIRFSTIEVYNSMKDKLEDRFTNAKTIPATQKIHKISPLEDCMVQVKMFSSSEKYLNHSTMKKRRESSSKKR